MADRVIAQPAALPVGPIGRHGLGQWGIGALIASEAALFSYLLFAYYYTAASAQPGWLLEARPAMWPALPNTVLLLASSFVAWFGEKGVEKGNRAQALAGLGGAFVMGAVFATVQMKEWADKPYRPDTSSYASLYFTTTGLHMAHVVAGLIILAIMGLWVALDYFSPRRRIVVSAGILYWHFVDIVWLFVFTTYYLTPWLGFGR
ncbi:heme-copper oxidase subunit III [Sphingomonas panacisoli]|uniref:Heme-copper oxidase subunit III n=1 Tax=Sphingomonas panacisoli TaxID=1813879 RepID=A0A5B8LGW7_9SPHN|nr:cytochrome c oxidase subunit 3 [Sphingomonas panacisoli]QDZ06874.1 heme-copper oxidase subunit III [Sphingomonas panacisoli]